MQQADIRLLLGQIMAGVERDNKPPQSFPDKEAQDAHKAEGLQIEKASKEAAFDLAASFLSAIFRIADAQERIAAALEYQPKELFALAGEAPHHGDHG